jgi:hypothetical protein
MPDNIYDVKVGDKLTPEQMREAAGAGAQPGQGEEIASFSAEDTPEKEENVDKPVEPPSYRYPLSIGTDYPVRIIFSAYELDFRVTKEFKQIEDEVDNIRGYVKSGVDSILNEEDPAEKIRKAAAVTATAVGTGAIASLSDSKIATGVGVVGGATLGLITAGGKISEFGTSASNIAKKSVDLTTYENYTKGKLVGKVTLPLQRGLMYNDASTYNQGATNFGQGIIGAAGSLISGENGELNQASGGLLSQVLSRVVGAGAVAALAKPAGMTGIGALAGAIGAEPLANFAKEASRVTLNPNLRTLFEGVQMRSFPMAFRMVAKSEQEAREVKNIVKFLRAEVYPEAISPSSDIPFGYKFPNVFDIQIKDTKGDNPAFDIQRCYLNSVTTTFNQTATGMYKGAENNYFIEVDLQLEFIEVMTMDKGKVEGGF